MWTISWQKKAHHPLRCENCGMSPIWYQHLGLAQGALYEMVGIDKYYLLKTCFGIYLAHSYPQNLFVAIIIVMFYTGIQSILHAYHPR